MMLSSQAGSRISDSVVEQLFSQVLKVGIVCLFGRFYSGRKLQLVMFRNRLLGFFEYDDVFYYAVI